MTEADTRRRLVLTCAHATNGHDIGELDQATGLERSRDDDRRRTRCGSAAARPAAWATIRERPRTLPFVSREHPTFEVDPAMVRVEFLGAHFKAPPVWREAAVGSKGLGHPRQRVQPQQVLAHSLWVPPSAWQDRVAEVQAGIDALKPWRTRTAAELDSLLPAILDQAFEGEF